MNLCSNPGSVPQCLCQASDQPPTLPTPRCPPLGNSCRMPPRVALPLQAKPLAECAWPMESTHAGKQKHFKNIETKSVTMFLGKKRKRKKKIILQF